MPLLLLKDLPQYDCLLQAAERYPDLDPRANEAFLHLLRTADLVFGRMGEFLTRHHTSQGRFTVMMLLAQDRERVHTPASLAEEANVTRATMTGLVDTLEKDGMVVREADVHDRRLIRVRLTEHGAATVQGMIPEFFQGVSAIMRALLVTEQRDLVALLQKIQQALTPETLLPTQPNETHDHGAV